MAPVRGRYAPSPTGLLHIGNARTALAAWLSVRQQQGTFVLRIEDLDGPRVLPGAEQSIIEDLRWLGIDWDEGPEMGGPTAPYRQSERSERYQRVIEHLASRDDLFPCFCSRADLRRLSSAPHGLWEEGPPYAGRCRTRILTPDDLHPHPGRLPSLRFRVRSGLICCGDAVHGRWCQDVERSVGDFVLRRADGLYAYQLAVVVDDIEMGITEVARGADLLDSTPRQLLLYEALGATPPRYAHVPLVLGPGGERLAKRGGRSSIRSLRERGQRAEHILGLLGWSLGALERPESVSAQDLIKPFAWTKVPREPWSLLPLD